MCEVANLGRRRRGRRNGELGEFEREMKAEIGESDGGSAETLNLLP